MKNEPFGFMLTINISTFFILDPCKDVVCKVEGEKCISGSSNPFPGKDILFGSLEILGNFNISSAPSSTSITFKECKCGIQDSCYNEKSDIQASSRCDFEKGMCMCGEMEECSGFKPWCVQQTCKCSNHDTEFVRGDGSIQGSCLGENEKCMADGSCQGKPN